MSDDIARRLQVLEDLEAIRTLKHRYANALDTSRWDDVVACFSADAVAEVGLGVQRGRKEIADMFHAVYGEAFEWVCHQACNPVIEMTSTTTAKGTWQLEAFFVMREGQRGLWTTVFYHDEYRKVDGSWQISYTKVTPIFRCDVEVGYAKQRLLDLSKA